NFDAIIPRLHGNALFPPDLRTHWKYSLPVKRFANFRSQTCASSRNEVRDLVYKVCGMLGGKRDQSPSERSLAPLGMTELYSLKRAASCSRCFSNSSGT